jgi:hypothetical protein
MTYICPICGYDGLIRPPKNDMICPSCGTQHGYDDFAHTPQELRQAWIQAGSAWWSQNERPPVGWNPYVQLSAIGFAIVDGKVIPCEDAASRHETALVS